MTEICYGEVGVYRRKALLKKNGFLDDEYDRDNPDGNAWGRRNFGHCQYHSGTGNEPPKHFKLTAFSGTDP